MKKVAYVADIRALNRSAVLTEILASSSTTRAEVCLATGLSGATVTRTVDDLASEGLVRQLEPLPTTGRGRPPKLLQVVTERALTVGVDLGAANTRLVLTDLQAEPTTAVRCKTPEGTSAEHLGGWLADLIREVAGDRWAAVQAIGVGLPGAVNPTTRQVSNAPHLQAVEDPRFLANLEHGVGRIVDLDNDANFALLGERYFGAARTATNAAMFTLGAGLGAGIMIDGRLIRGTHGLVGEFGSIPAGPFGSRLEHLVTGRGIMVRASELGLELDSPADIFQPTDNELLTTLRLQFEQALLVALTAAVVSCDPDVIVLGGAIASSLETRIDSLEQSLAQALRTNARIATADLGDLSGALGAAVQALHRVFAALGVPDDALSRMPPQRPLHTGHLNDRLSAPS
jgi:predicted NBD/HSP70 family sugar kinase